MIHSGPKPLKVALEIAKRLQTELGKHLTPEQRRDFVRVAKLIDEAERNHIVELTRLHQRTSTAAQAPAATPAPAPAKKRFWFSS